MWSRMPWALTRRRGHHLPSEPKLGRVVGADIGGTMSSRYGLRMRRTLRITIVLYLVRPTSRPRIRIRITASKILPRSGLRMTLERLKLKMKVLENRRTSLPSRVR
jgi:hypothetical protein